MKSLVATLLLLAGLAVPAAAGDYTLEGVFQSPRGDIVHVSPYPASKRAASVWASSACWRDCASSCAWKNETCMGASGADACRPQLDGCDRACLRSCRTRGGPLLAIFAW